MVNLIAKNYKQPKLLNIKNLHNSSQKKKILHKYRIFVFESEGGGTKFQPIKTKCVKTKY